MQTGEIAPGVSGPQKRGLMGRAPLCAAPHLAPHRDIFVVPTISFRLLYGLLIMGHGRRQILWFGVTAHPTAEWIANQLTEACGWEQIPRYLVRDRDRAY